MQISQHRHPARARLRKLELLGLIHPRHPFWIDRTHSPRPRCVRARKKVAKNLAKLPPLPPAPNSPAKTAASRTLHALFHASFAAGPDLVPFLEASLKDDRTAEFAAQSLAFIGGDKALKILNGFTTGTATKADPCCGA